MSEAVRKVWQAGTLTYTSAALVALFAWLLAGDFAWAIKDRTVLPVVQLVLKKFEASDMLNGLLIGGLPALVGALIGPIISYRSDRHRGRWGRRIPYLLLTTPIAALAIVGLAFSPALGSGLHEGLGARSPGLNPSILILFALFWTVFEFATVAAEAVLGGLINDVVPRAFIGRFYGLFRALSLLAAMLFNYFLLGYAESHHVAIFTSVGIVYGVGFSVMCLKVKEGAYPPVASEPSAGMERFAAVRRYCAECFSDSHYVWIYVMQTVAKLGFFCFNLFSVFFAKSVGMDMATFGKYAALVYLVSLALSYALGALADRFHPLRVGIVALALYAAFTLWGAFFATDARSFGFTLVAHGVVSGAFFTGAASLGQRLYPKSSFAQMTSAAAVMLALGQVVLSPGLGKLLDVTGHNYRMTLFAGSALTFLALLSAFVVYRRFRQLGGPAHYVAPVRAGAAADSSFA